jgi:hypothetical protein
MGSRTNRYEEGAPTGALPIFPLFAVSSSGIPQRGDYRGDRRA